MGSIALLIFDEAHHCNKRHFYNQVMDYYRQACTLERPRIFGMTACPVNTKVRPSGHHRMSGCRGMHLLDFSCRTSCHCNLGLCNACALCLVCRAQQLEAHVCNA